MAYMISEKELANEYPEIFEYWHKDPDEIAGPAPQISIYGFQHGEGWHSIIEALCEMLERRNIEVKVVQTKEKFGGLRFYHGGVQTEEERESYMAMGAIQHAEEMSFHVCEDCGASAELRQEGWYRTLCDECWTDEKARRRQS
jgi:hypothetical protein